MEPAPEDEARQTFSSSSTTNARPDQLRTAIPSTGTLGEAGSNSAESRGYQLLAPVSLEAGVQHILDGFVFGGWDVANLGAQPGGGEPADPFGGGTAAVGHDARADELGGGSASAGPGVGASPD